MVCLLSTETIYTNRLILYNITIIKFEKKCYNYLEEELERLANER